MLSRGGREANCTWDPQGWASRLLALLLQRQGLHGKVLSLECPIAGVRGKGSEGESRPAQRTQIQHAADGTDWAHDHSPERGSFLGTLLVPQPFQTIWGETPPSGLPRQPQKYAHICLPRPKNIPAWWNSDLSDLLKGQSEAM